MYGSCFKILHVIDSGGLYGAERVLITLATQQLRGKNLKPTILSLGELNESEKAIEVEAKEQNIPVIGWRMRAGLNFKGLDEILEWANSEGFDLLHSHGYKFDILLGLSCKRKALGLPFVATVHGYTSTRLWSKMGLYRILDYFCLLKASSVAVVSSVLQRSLRFHPQVTMIPNGISQTQVQVRSTEGLETSGERYLVAVGRLSKEKAIDDLIKAFSRLNTEPGLQLVIVGEGPERSALEALVSRLKLESKVRFLGFVQNPATILQCAEALVIPSRSEGLPLTLLEALRERIPVIATPVGEIPVVLQEGKCGYLARGTGVSALFEVMRTFYSMPVGQRERVEQGYQRFLKYYTVEGMEAAYRRFYFDACSRNKSFGIG